MPSPYPVLRTHRPTFVQPEPLTLKGGDGGGEGDGGGGGGDGDGDGGGGGDGGECFATKDTVSSCLHGFLEQRGAHQRFRKEKVSPKLGAAHCAPFQPSPHVSIMVRVHVAPIVTANGELDV